MQKLSDCEEKVMLVIWQSKELLSYKDIMIKVEERFGDKWKSETACTFIDRLRRKGYLHSVKEGRYTYSEAIVNFDNYRKAQLQELIKKLYSGHTPELMKDIQDDKLSE